MTSFAASAMPVDPAAASSSPSSTSGDLASDCAVPVVPCHMTMQVTPEHSTQSCSWDRVHANHEGPQIALLHFLI